MVTGGSSVSMIYRVPYWPVSNGGCSCLQGTEWLLSTNSSWWASVEKWQWKLCRMANQYCIYAQWGDSIAHLPEQQGFHRYIPVDFWGRIMNISLFRATKTQRSIVMAENSVSWKALLNNYRLSDIPLSATPCASSTSWPKQTFFIDSVVSHPHELCTSSESEHRFCKVHISAHEILLLSFITRVRS